MSKLQTPGFSQVSEWVINRETVLWKGLSSQYLTLRVRWSITSPQDGRSASTSATDTRYTTGMLRTQLNECFPLAVINVDSFRKLLKQTALVIGNHGSI